MFCSLSSLSSLKVVKASENQFSDGLPEVISSILSLKQLDVSNCQLQSLPSRYFKQISMWHFFITTVYSVLFYLLLLNLKNEISFCKNMKTHASLHLR